LDFYSFLSIII